MHVEVFHTEASRDVLCALAHACITHAMILNALRPTERHLDTQPIRDGSVVIEICDRRDPSGKACWHGESASFEEAFEDCWRRREEWL